MAATLKVLPFLLGIAQGATAQGADPTRPPAQLRAEPGAEAASVPAADPRLQSLRMGPGIRAAAVIDGRLVHVGDRLHGTRLVAAIAEGAVLLRPVNAQTGGQWLRLATDIKKTPAGVETR